MELAHAAMKQSVLNALSGRPEVASEPLVTRRADAPRPRSPACAAAPVPRGDQPVQRPVNVAAGGGRFAAERGSPAVADAAVSVPAASTSTETPLPCGSDLTYKECHALKAA
jgi:hypothetical protein